MNRAQGVRAATPRRHGSHSPRLNSDFKVDRRIMVTPSGNDAPARRVVIRTTDFDEAHRAMERAFLPMDMWPMEPLTALDMLLDQIQIDDMMTSTIKFGRDIGLRSAEASSYHVAAPVSGVAESQAGYQE